jgi:hypothetical protein
MVASGAAFSKIRVVVAVILAEMLPILLLVAIVSPGHGSKVSVE